MQKKSLYFFFFIEEGKKNTLLYKIVVFDWIARKKSISSYFRTSAKKVCPKYYIAKKKQYTAKVDYADKKIAYSFSSTNFELKLLVVRIRVFLLMAFGRASWGENWCHDVNRVTR